MLKKIGLVILIALVGVILTGCISRYQGPQNEFVQPRYGSVYENLSQVEFDLKVDSLERHLHEYISGPNAATTWVNRDYEAISNEIKKCYYVLAEYEDDIRFVEEKSKDPHNIFSVSVDNNIPKVRKYVQSKKEKLDEIGESIEIYNKRFRVDHDKYTSRLNKRREQLISLIASYGIPNDRIYSDDVVVAYLESATRNSNNITFKVIAFKILPHEDLQLNNIRLPMRMVSSPCKVPSNAVWLYSSTDKIFGSPTSMDCEEKVGKETRLRYFSVSFDGIPGPDEMFKIEIERLALLNQKKFSFSIPSTLLKEVDSGNDATSSNDLSDKDFGVISCRKMNDHLIVPTTLNIHGKDVKVDLLLDTGASLTIIPLKAYLTGNPKEIPALEKKEFQTANGKVLLPVDIITVNTTGFSKNIEVAMSDDNNLGLLGSNYFKGTVFTVDTDNECIYVHASERNSK